MTPHVRIRRELLKLGYVFSWRHNSGAEYWLHERSGAQTVLPIALTHGQCSNLLLRSRQEISTARSVAQKLEAEERLQRHWRQLMRAPA